MIPLKQFKKLLGEEGENLTNEEVEKIRQAQYQFAELAFEIWKKDKNLIGKVNKNKRM